MAQLSSKSRLAICSALLQCSLGCSSQSVPPGGREVTRSDPIAAVISRCPNLFARAPDSNTCEFVEDRGNAGADIVRERIACAQAGEFVSCKARPGEGPGPEEYWLDFRCSRIDQTCQITSGAPSYVESYTPLFESHNRIVASNAKNADQ